MNVLKSIMRRVFPDRQGEMNTLEVEKLKRLVRAIVTTRPDEIGCDECFEQLDRFVEMELAGRNPAEAMPLVEDHLSRCRECREEFEALLGALRAMA